MSKSNLIKKEVFKVNKAVMIKAVFEEIMVALTNDYDSIWNGMFINLFNLDGRDVMDEDDTLLIDDGSGNPEEMMREEIEDLICSKIMTAQDMIERSLDATEDNMILVLDE